jgi:hypothetical protein
MLFVFLEDGTQQPEIVEADRTAETLTGSTVDVTYSLESITEHNETIFTDTSGGDAFNRTTHGTVAELLSSAAVSNTQFWEHEYTRGGDAFERAVDGAIRGQLTGLNHSVRVNAIWRPYRGSGIEGTASAGSAVPPDADVSSVTISVDSGMPDVSSEVRRVYDRSDGDFDETASIIAEAVVDGFLPPQETQRALESEGLQRKITLYRYVRMSTVMANIHKQPEWNEPVADSDWEPVSAQYPFNHNNDSRFGRENINTAWLNQFMIQKTLSKKIAADLDRQFDAKPRVEELVSSLSTGETKLIIRTWEE